MPLLGIYLKKMKTLIQKDMRTPIFPAALFIIAKIWKQQSRYLLINMDKNDVIGSLSIATYRQRNIIQP